MLFLILFYFIKATIFILLAFYFHLGSKRLHIFLETILDSTMYSMEAIVHAF